jgi:hypothetical protein|tara:strand:- start:83 stop:754 length:672 start_codon:yes stop_codon:yes gene_type:complete
MTLPSSGALSLSAIAGEFGGSTPHSINEYYRGGSNVLNNSNTASIPTSGQIDFADFYGTSSAVPANNNIAGTLGNTAPLFNKFNVNYCGASTATAPALYSNAMPYGSFSDNTFTNPAGSSTFTVDQFNCSVSVFFAGTADATICLIGNYAGQTWNAVTGRTGLTIQNVSFDFTSRYQGFTSPPSFTTPVFNYTATGNFSQIGTTKNSSSVWSGNGISFTGTIY